MTADDLSALRAGWSWRN